jgi:hypothetical protein
VAGGFECAVRWVVHDAFDLGLRQVRQDELGFDDRARSGLTYPLEMSDTHREGEQRLRPNTISWHRRRACRHLDQRRGPPLSRAAFDTITDVLESELFVEPVELAFDDLTGHGVEVAVDEHPALDRHAHH